MAKVNTLEEAQEATRHLMHHESVIVDGNGHIYCNQSEATVREELKKKDKLFIVK